MSKTPNPYESPGAYKQFESWWQSIWRMFSARKFRVDSFAGGAKLIVEGIAFYLDSAQPEFLIAASPSSDVTDERMKLVAAEAIRLLPLFLKRYPELHDTFAGRRFIARLITAYCDNPTSYLRQHEVEGDKIAEAIRRLKITR